MALDWPGFLTTGCSPLSPLKEKKEEVYRWLRNPAISRTIPSFFMFKPVLSVFFLKELTSFIFISSRRKEEEMRS
jgi:hypothetical protein